MHGFVPALSGGYNIKNLGASPMQGHRQHLISGVRLPARRFAWWSVVTSPVGSGAETHSPALFVLSAMLCVI